MLLCLSFCEGPGALQLRETADEKIEPVFHNESRLGTEMTSYVNRFESAEVDGDPRLATDRDQLDCLYRLHWAELCRHVRKVFGVGPPEPEDVVQGAFARFAALERPGDIINPRAFLYKCARNIVLDHRRREKVRDRFDDDAVVLNFDADTASLDAERVLSGKQRLVIVEATIRAMEARQRRVLIMHAIHGQNYSEIARRMGLSPTRITQLFARAVQQCDQALRKADGDSDGAPRNGGETSHE
jgi:RNA polymerase sigma factor (sigma-70 family)